MNNIMANMIEKITNLAEGRRERVNTIESMGSIVFNMNVL